MRNKNGEYVFRLSYHVRLNFDVLKIAQFAGQRADLVGGRFNNQGDDAEFFFPVRDSHSSDDDVRMLAENIVDRGRGYFPLFYDDADDADPFFHF